MQERRFLALACEKRLDEFEVADRHGIEHQGIRTIIERRAFEMIERGALRVAQVMQHRACRSNSQRLRS